MPTFKQPGIRYFKMREKFLLAFLFYIILLDKSHLKNFFFIQMSNLFSVIYAFSMLALLKIRYQTEQTLQDQEQNLHRT